jgi:hypothetical protein
LDGLFLSKGWSVSRSPFGGMVERGYRCRETRVVGRRGGIR